MKTMKPIIFKSKLKEIDRLQSAIDVLTIHSQIPGLKESIKGRIKRLKEEVNNVDLVM